MKLPGGDGARFELRLKPIVMVVAEPVRVVGIQQFATMGDRQLVIDNVAKGEAAGLLAHGAEGVPLAVIA